MITSKFNVWGEIFLLELQIYAVYILKMLIDPNYISWFFFKGLKNAHF